MLTGRTPTGKDCKGECKCSSSSLGKARRRTRGRRKGAEARDCPAGWLGSLVFQVCWPEHILIITMTANITDELSNLRVVAKIYTLWFDLPLYSLVPFITERLLLETDFVNEADNAERMAQLVAGEPRLNGRVYVPKVYRELSSRRVMTAEWIEGVRLWDKEHLTRRWEGKWRQGSPGCHGAALDSPEHRDIMNTVRSNLVDEKLKPDRDWWKGKHGQGGLGLSLKDVMTTMIDLFSAQMFLWGYVHCDPHPGNIFIRRLPSGKPELVLIDHGLYVHMKPDFRHQYCLFWKSLMTFDNKTLVSLLCLIFYSNKPGAPKLVFRATVTPEI